MVMAALGDDRSESHWASFLGSYEFGTPSSRVTRLASLGCRVDYRRFSLEELVPELENHRHPIVFVRADLLPWADFGGFHSLVLTEITPTDVALLDPALNHGPTRLSRDGFLVAWEEFDCLAAIISR
jgi:hypothetical protein